MRVRSKPTRDTEEKSITLPYYAATYPNAIIRYKVRSMAIHVGSDAAYLTMLESIRCYTGNLYLGDFPSPRPIKPNPERNGPINTDFKTIHNVVSSVAESETCGTFNNEKTIVMRPELIALYHKQPTTPPKTDNYMIEGFVNSDMKPNFSKTWDMKLHWLRDK